jgi:hypothetical protein
MSIHNGLLGLAVLVSMTGLATAAPAPPIDPRVEGRESNPVEREYYQSEKAVGRYGSVPVPSSQSKDEWVELLNSWSPMATKAWQLLLNQSSLAGKGVPDRQESK